jgi:hypothetical protein
MTVSPAFRFACGMVPRTVHIKNTVIAPLTFDIEDQARQPALRKNQDNSLFNSANVILVIQVPNQNEDFKMEMETIIKLSRTANDNLLSFKTP